MRDGIGAPSAREGVPAEDRNLSEPVRVAELHRQAAADYATGQGAREGMDRADALRREMWGTPTSVPGTPS